MKIEPSVSLCIIAKDEANCITACIQSAAGLVEEIILVDTGSSDRTVELAGKLGARTLSFDWSEDFAAARNFGLFQATGDWILVLDADEILESVNREALTRLLTAPRVEGYFLTIRSLLGNGEEEVSDQVIRLFKNNPLYRFEGAIHEQVAASIRRHSGDSALALADIAIFHTGYLQERITTKAKHQRNIGVIKQALAANPEDPFLLYSLGIEYTQDGNIAQGNEFLAASLVRLKGGEGYFRHVITTLGTGLLQAGERGQLARLLDKAFAIFPGDPELSLLKGIATLLDGEWQAAAESLQQAAAAKTDSFLSLYRIQALLGDALAMTGCYDQAGAAYSAACQLEPQWPYPEQRLLELRHRRQRADLYMSR